MSYGVKLARIGVDAFVKNLAPRAKDNVPRYRLCLYRLLRTVLKGSWDYLSQMYQIGVPYGRY